MHAHLHTMQNVLGSKSHTESSLFFKVLGNVLVYITLRVFEVYVYTYT